MTGKLIVAACLPLLAGAMACSASEASEGEEASSAEPSAQKAPGGESAAAAEAEQAAAPDAGAPEPASIDLGAYIYHLEPAICQEGPGLMGAGQAIAYQPGSDPLRFFPEPARAAMSDFKRESRGRGEDMASVAVDGLWNGLRLTSINWSQHNGRWGQPQFVFEEPGTKVIETLKGLGYPAKLNESVVGKVDDLTRSKPVITVDEDVMGEPFTYFTCGRVPTG